MSRWTKHPTGPSKGRPTATATLRRVLTAAGAALATVAATLALPAGSTLVAPAPAAAAEPHTHVIVADVDAFDPEGGFNGRGGLIDVDLVTGARTKIASGGVFTDPYGVTVDRDGSYLVIDRDAGGHGMLIRVDPATGDQTAISSDQYFGEPTSVKVDANGDYLVADAQATFETQFGTQHLGAILRVDHLTGLQSVVASGAPIYRPTGLDIAPDGTIFVADRAAEAGGGTSGAVIRVDPGTGRQDVLASHGSFHAPRDLVVAPNGDLLVLDPDWDAGDGGIVRIPAAVATAPGSPDRHPTLVDEVTGRDSWGNPYGLTQAPNGDIVVADPDWYNGGSGTPQGAIVVVSPADGYRATTALTPSEGSGFRRPTGLALVPDPLPAPPPGPTGPYAPVTVTPPAASQPSCTSQAYTVPQGVTRLAFTVIGSGGVHGRNDTSPSGSNGGSGGFGAIVTGTLSVSPGEVLWANVAHNGTGGASGGLEKDAAGVYTKGRGGDMSFLSSGSRPTAREEGGCDVGGFLVAAGAGGGGGDPASDYGGTGGDAGVPDASNGRSGGPGGTVLIPGRGGGGATQTAGGKAAPSGSADKVAAEGAWQVGGDAARNFSQDCPIEYIPVGCTNYRVSGGGGGGGGGIFGGGGGGAGIAGGGGGGGSSWVDPARVTSPGYQLAGARLTPPAIRLTPLGASSTVSLVAAPASAGLQDPVTLTATVSPAPGKSPLPADPGTITFRVGGTTLGTARVDATTGVATLSTRFATSGARQVTADYGGNGFLTAGSGWATVLVTGSAPQWTSPTPGEGAVLDATPGTPVVVQVKATDADAGDQVTLSVTGRPSGSTFETTPGNPATGTLTWTPSAAGDTALVLTATDGHDGSVQRHVTVRATQKSPVISWATPPSITYGTPLGEDQLDASLSTAAGAPRPPHAGTFTYEPAAGTRPHAGDRTLSVTWRPDPADAAGWSPVTATVTLHVNQAGQTLTFQPAIDDGTTRSYGDPPFTVRAVSSAGLPVTYSVGAGDACTLVPSDGGGTTVTITAAGPCTLSADQPGDADHTAAATLSHSFTVAKKTPVVVLSPADSVYGTPLGADQLAASLTPAGAAGHGSLSYRIDGEELPADGILPAGTHTLTATYTPDAGSSYNAASASASFTVAPAEQTITFADLGARTFGDPSFDVTASASSGLAVSFATSTADVCAVTATGVVSLLHAGTCTITASQAGDENHLAAEPVTHDFTVGRAGQRIDFEQPADQTYLGAPGSLRATGGGSGNPVVFTAAPASVCTVTGGTTLTATGAGRCTVTASQAGDADHTAAADVERTVTVRKATPTVSWAAPGSIRYGTALGEDQLAASVAPAVEGTFAYTLADGTTDARGAVLHAADTPYTLRVTFTPAAPDDANFTSATARTTITVTRASQTISWGGLPDLTYGDPPFVVPVTGGGSGKPVTLTVQDGSRCTVDGLTVTITAAGACVLQADQAGDGDHDPAPTSTRSITASRRTPTISWDPPAPITFGTALGAAELAATVMPAEAGEHGTLAYATDAGAGDAAGQRLHAGVHTLTVTYTPDEAGPGASYTAATASTTLVVEQAAQAIAFAQPEDATFGDPPVSLSATGGGSGQPVTFTVGAGSSCAVSGEHGTTLALTGAGSCTVVAHQDGDADHEAAPDVARTFTVARAAQTITFAPPATAGVADKDLRLSATGGGSGNPVTFTAGPAATCSVTSSGVLTITGPGTCAITASQAGDADHEAAPSVTRTVTVSYRVCQLSDADQRHQLGGVVQLSATVCDASGRSLASPTVVLHATTVDGADEAEAPGNSQPGNNFRYSAAHGGSYRYNLVVDDLGAGTHRLEFTVSGDPTAHAVTFTMVGH